MNELFARTQLFRLVAFGNGGFIIAFAIKSHAQGKLRVKVRGVSGQDRSKLGDSTVEVAAAEIEHRVIILFLQSHLT